MNKEIKIAINVKFGGFGLSPLATKMIAERKGLDCYFFEYDFDSKKYIPLSLEEAEKAFVWHAYTVPNPEDYNLHERDEDGLYKSANKRAESISLPDFREDSNRTDLDLIAVIEELGEKANDKYAKLKVVEIPSDVDWQIEEYDGYEHIAEKHRTWG